MGACLKELQEHPRLVNRVKGHGRLKHMQRWAGARTEQEEGPGAGSGAAEQLHQEISSHQQTGDGKHPFM